jgi:hypothetical protein
VDQSHFPEHISHRPEGWRYRPRLCLLKGCERWYWPRHPCSHYCSEACRQAAKRWRRWHASQSYRRTENGREQRRQQSRRYRQRVRERIRASADVDTPGEGQRLGPESENFSGQPCDRPGCYQLFRLAHEHVCKRFCSVACRLALRRVLDREARYHERRRRLRPKRLTRPPRPADTS